MDKILVNIDFKHDPSAQLEKAVYLAKQNDSFIELFSCCYNRAIVQGYLFDKQEEKHAEHAYVKQVEAKLEALCAPIQEQGVRVGFDVSWNRHNSEGVVRKVLRFEPDILIHAVQPHSRLGHYLFAPVDWQIARKCPVPVLFVKNTQWAEHTRMVACIDPLHEGDQSAALDTAIIEQSLALAPDYFTEIRFVHCFNTLPHEAIFDEHMVTDYEALRERVENKHVQACNTLLQPHGFDVTHEQVAILHGEAEQMITAYVSDHKIDVITLGAVARSVLDRLLVGSTIEYLVDHVECDVLVVKPPGFICPITES
jgi:universal stress protein E